MIVFFILYVDDILLIENDILALQRIKVWLSSQFSMMDLGDASYILGMKIYRDKSKRMLGLSQSTYIDIVLKRFSMKDFKKGYLSIGHGITFSKTDCLTTPQKRECMSKISYISTVGSIMYAMTYTRLNKAYSLGVVSRYQFDPGENHWKVVKTIFKYLRNTKD